MRELPSQVLVDADFFISILRGDELAGNALRLLDKALRGEVMLQTSSETYDDIISAYRSGGYTTEEIISLLSDIRSIPHRAIPITDEIALKAMELYAEHGGRGKLHYFDAFHIATAIKTQRPLITSDRYILENAERLGIKAIDLREV
ncbi:MAG TPA: type II toxin-antitoxin system VapC family toxin [Candidatus Bathyarchaeota archaeon]|nr:type II toxin-antitoxin system VapC family toxin [Candidatus Bathyarchaeota archaeon]